MKFGFVTCLQDHISLSDKFDSWLFTSEWPRLRLDQQSYYRYRKRQLVPTDWYRFWYIGKLIASSKHLGGAKALGGCRSLGCCGYLRALLDAHISLGTATRFHRHLLQAYLLAMSLNVAKCNLVKVKINPMLVSGVRRSRAPSNIRVLALDGVYWGCAISSLYLCISVAVCPSPSLSLGWPW